MRWITIARTMLLVWILQTCIWPVSGAWAQRGGTEPEANPQFQQEVQGSAPSPGGQPIDSGGGEGSPKADIPKPLAEVQMGEVQGRKSSSTGSLNPLDVRVSIRVRDAALASFLEIISNQAKINFILSEGLKEKTVTAFLQNVSVREALQILLEIKGLTYQQIGKSNSYIIRERTKDIPLLITRVYTLSYAPLVSIAAPGSSGSSSGGSGAGGPGGLPGMPVTPSIGGGGPSGGSGTGQVSADSGISIVQVIKSILSREGHISIDPRTNSVVVTDIPEVFPQIEQIISELDKKAPQVIIEAQIVEIDSDKTRNLGIEWGGADGTLATFTGPQHDTAFPLFFPHNMNKTQPFPTSGIVSSVGSSANSSSSSSSSGSSGSGAVGATLPQSILTGTNIRTGILDLTQLQLVLRALVSHSQARFLGKPKVLTLNNKTAIIQISRDQAVAVQTAVSGTNGTGSLTTATPQREQTGLRLEVTPQVNREGYITMLVQPEYTSVVQAAVSTATTPIYDPIKRSESTLVRVKNGQTLVLGGLLTSIENKEIRKVPFFGYIPIIGWLFTSTTYSLSNVDIVIFLTPTIIAD